MTPDEIRRAVEAGDFAALGRAQARGEDIRLPEVEPAPVERPEPREITVGEFLAAVDRLGFSDWRGHLAARFGQVNGSEHRSDS